MFLKFYFNKGDKSTSDSLRLNSTTVLDDTADSPGKPLKLLTHLLRSHFQTAGYDKTSALCNHSIAR